jgi:hypothetical protein
MEIVSNQYSDIIIEDIVEYLSLLFQFLLHHDG